MDLTQVTHENSREKEHELELELDTAVLEEEMENLRRSGKCSIYEHIADLLLNSRVLIREGG